jgi:hypothetical protein
VKHLARDLHFLDEPDYDKLATDLSEVRKMLSSLDPEDRARIAGLNAKCQLLTALQNLVTSVKLKCLIFIAGTTMSKDSSPLARTGGPMASTFESM